MTELEQKAEEYVSFDEVENLLKQAYIDGYGQGVKTKADMLGTFINVDLEEENEELKKAITEKNSEVEELKAQIEKMKCCGNCKYIGKGEIYCYAYEQDNIFVEKCLKWELAE